MYEGHNGEELEKSGFWFEIPALALLPWPKAQSLSIGCNGLPAKTARREASRPPLSEISADTSPSKLEVNKCKIRNGKFFPRKKRQKCLDHEEIDVKKCQLGFKNSKQCPSSQQLQVLVADGNPEIWTADEDAISSIICHRRFDIEKSLVWFILLWISIKELAISENIE